MLRVSSGFQTLENNKTTRPAASWFQMFSRVWKPDETLALVFEIVLLNKTTTHKGCIATLLIRFSVWLHSLYVIGAWRYKTLYSDGEFRTSVNANTNTSSFSRIYLPGRLYLIDLLYGFSVQNIHIVTRSFIRGSSDLKVTT